MLEERFSPIDGLFIRNVEESRRGTINYYSKRLQHRWKNKFGERCWGCKTVIKVTSLFCKIVSPRGRKDPFQLLRGIGSPSKWNFTRPIDSLWKIPTRSVPLNSPSESKLSAIIVIIIIIIIIVIGNSGVSRVIQRLKLRALTPLLTPIINVNRNTVNGVN